MEENNKLIAEFMGYKENPYVIMQYHNNWIWLMDVVDKIEFMGFTTSIKTSYVRINPKENAGYEHYISYITFNEYGWASRKTYTYDHNDYDMGNISYDPKERIDKRRAVYEAVVAFINWYNKNKKK